MKFRIAEKKYIFLCFLVAFFFITLCSRCSFLYVFNDWVDVNCFFTVGKSMMNGLVLYKDIFEHKGPLVYFIYGIAYLISNQTFYAVYIIEILCSTVFLFYAVQCLLLYSEKFCIHKTFIWMSLPVYASLIYSSLSFYAGGSVEELIMPLQAIGLYWLLLYVRTKIISQKKIFFAGILAGCILWIKFTLLGQFFWWMAMIFFMELYKKEYKKAIYYCVIFLLGMLVATLPWIIYFSYHHAIKDWIEVYFYNNLFLYSHVSTGILETVKDWIVVVFQQMRYNLQFSFFIVVGIFSLILTKKISVIEKVTVPLCFFWTVFFIYIGGQAMIYYAFPCSLYAIFGMLLPAKMLQIVYDTIKKIKYIRKGFVPVSSIGICVSMLLYANIRSINTDTINNTQEDLVIFHLKDIIEEENNNPSLLEYGCMDIGMYTITGTVPVCKYFCAYNLPLQDIKEQQEYFIQQQLMDYVICLDWYDNIILDTYTLLYEETQFVSLDQKERTYYLFQKK